jgi:hypothetical protein
MCTSKEGKVTHMKKGLTELVFILDTSGSIGGLERDPIFEHVNVHLEED